MLRFYTQLRNISTFPLFWLVASIDFLYNIITSLLVRSFDESLIDTGLNTENNSLLEIFCLSVLIGPLIETFIFHFLIIEILHKLKVHTNAIIWCSAFAFSLFHNYNIIYILLILFPGLLYAGYYLYLKKVNHRFPFMMIFMLHALSNFLSFLFDDVWSVMT